MRLLRIIKRTFLYLLVALAVFFTAGSISIYLYEEEIVQHLIRQANERIKTPIHVEKIELSWWAHFPAVSLVFNDVLVEENAPNAGALASLDQVQMSFSLLDLLQKNYTINNIKLVRGEVNLLVDDSGRPNYNIFEKQETGSGGIGFTLQEVSIDDVQLLYTDKRRRLDYDLQLDAVNARLELINNYYLIDLEGGILTNRIAVRQDSYLNNKYYNVEAKLHYNADKRALTINPSHLKFGSASFGVEGTYNFDKAVELDITINGENTDIQTILSFLPETFQKKYESYKSEGDAYFNAHVQGQLSASSVPAVQIDFGIGNGEIFHASSSSNVEQANLRGSYSNENLFDLKSADLHLTAIDALLDGKKVSGDIRIKNFQNPTLQLDLSGALAMRSLLDFYPIEAVASVAGTFEFDLDFKGRLQDLKSTSTTDDVQISGDLMLKGIDLEFKEKPIALSNVSGNLIFNGKDLAINGVSGNLGNSDFKLRGFFRNILAYLFFDDQDIGIEADLESDLLDLDELLAANNGDSRSYAFRISPELFLSFDCNVKALKFRRLQARNVSGKLKVKDQLAVAKEIKGSAMGGALTISGMVNARNPQQILVDTEATLRNISIDKVFYVFENFNQSWLVDENLKGQIFADVSTEMLFDNKLKFDAGSFVSDISIAIHNGQLNNFEPMAKLSKYVDESDLSQLRFSELKNEIHIEDKTIFLPEMEVSSNVTAINISGTHTFDQRIDYRVVVPLRMKESYDSDEIFGAIEDNGTGKSKLHLKITGTTSDYRITYDAVGVKNKIVADLKKEVEELKAAFKNKGRKKKKVLQLNEDEYFDWEDNENPKEKKKNDSNH